jgi:Protein of unknown function (DUF3500)
MRFMLAVGRHAKGRLMPITRRRLIAGAALAAALPHPALAQMAGDTVARARDFLAMLDPEKRAAAMFAFGDETWTGWNFMGAGGFIKPGLRLEQMTVPEREAAWAMLGTMLSPAGLDKAQRVMDLQDVLTELGGSGRSSLRFSIAFFGEPAETGVFGIRLEGHHLSLSHTVKDGQVVAMTPSSFSSNPNIVPQGTSRAGLVALRGEEDLARRLMADLSARQAAVARISDTPMRNILSRAGSETDNADPVGIPVADLTSAQADLLWELIETYAVEHLVPPLADRQRVRLREGDAASVRFAWTGGNEPGTRFGYRIIGDPFVIELGSVDDAALHLHTIWHDRETVLGRNI